MRKHTGSKLGMFKVNGARTPASDRKGGVYSTDKSVCMQATLRMAVLVPSVAASRGGSAAKSCLDLLEDRTASTMSAGGRLYFHR